MPASKSVTEQLRTGEGLSRVIERLRTYSFFKDNSTVEKLIRLLWDHSQEIMLISNGGKILAANPATIRILGWGPREISSRSFLEFISEKDRGETKKVIYGGRGEFADLTNRVLRMDGKEICVSWSGNYMKDGPYFFAIGRVINPDVENCPFGCGESSTKGERT